MGIATLVTDGDEVAGLQRRILGNGEAAGGVDKALQLGDLEIFHADSGRLGFSRRWDDRKLKIYVNRTDKAWTIPADFIVLNCGLQFKSLGQMTLAPMGCCIAEEYIWGENLWNTKLF